MSYRYRSGTTAFTEQGAGHYTNDTIDWHRHMESNHNYQFRKLVYYPLYDGDIFGRGDEIRTHDTDFKDQCLRPLGDTPTIKQDSIFWLFFKKRFLMFAVAILNW